MAPNRDLDKLEVLSVLLGIHIYSKQIPIWTKELKKMKSYKSKINLSKLDPRFQKLTEKTLMLSYFLGFDEIGKEVKEQLINLRDVNLLIGVSSFNRDFESIDKRILELRKKDVISAEEFKKASAEIKKISFSVQKLEDKNIINAVKISISTALNNGVTFAEWQGDLIKVFESYGITPLKPHHIETVFRTNLNSVYNSSRFRAGKLAKNVEAWEYFTIDDNRRSEICTSLDGKVYLKTDPFWDLYAPPNHYN